MSIKTLEKKWEGNGADQNDKNRLFNDDREEIKNLFKIIKTGINSNWILYRMPKVGKGVPPPAKITDIIDDLFENEKMKNPDNTRVFFTFSRAQLTDQQKQALTYPHGLTPLDLYIVYQTDQFDEQENLISTNSTLVSFAEKGDGFTYAYYFSLSNQERLSIKQLSKSPESIQLSPNVKLTYDNYLEVYNNVLGTTIILGLSTTQPPLASLQYATKSKYFYEDLSENGINQPNLPETVLTGLSKNLSEFD